MSNGSGMTMSKIKGLHDIAKKHKAVIEGNGNFKMPAHRVEDFHKEAKAAGYEQEKHYDMIHSPMLGSHTIRYGIKPHSQHSEGDTEEAAESTEEALEAIYESDEPEQFAHREPGDSHLATELHLVDQHNVRKLDTHGYGLAGPEGKGEHHLHQQREAILSNLGKKKAKGVYDHEKAKKLWGHYAKSLSDHYKTHYGAEANPATRALVASKLADHYKDHQHSEEESTVNRYSELTPEQAEEIVSENRFLNRPRK